MRYTQDGKQKSKSFQTFIEADKARRRITAAIDAGTYTDPSKMKLGDWMDKWLKDYCGHIKSGTLVQYKGYVKNHIKPELGMIRLCDLRPHRVQQFVNELKNQGKKADGELSYKTKKNIHGCLSVALERAVTIKYIPENPASGCIIPSGNQEVKDKEVNPFKTEELNAFLSLIGDSKYKEIYELALGTGMRLSEILGLQWSKVDFKAGTILVDKQLLILREKGGKRELGVPKYGRIRSFKAAKSIMVLLQKIKKQQARNKLAAGSAWNSEIDDLVLTNEIGGTVPHASVEHEFKELVTNAGCPEHRFHDLRHTFATTALAHGGVNGANIKTLSKALGHKSVAFTLDVYVHIVEEMSTDFAEVIDDVIVSRRKA